jgi:hypothetical protein
MRSPRLIKRTDVSETTDSKPDRASSSPKDSTRLTKEIVRAGQWIKDRQPKGVNPRKAFEALFGQTRPRPVN